MSVREIAAQITACNELLAFIEELLTCIGDNEHNWTLVLHSVTGESHTLEVREDGSGALQDLLIPGLQTPMEALKAECEVAIAELGASMTAAAASSVAKLALVDPE
jgi:hypothetical protein